MMMMMTMKTVVMMTTVKIEIQQCNKNGHLWPGTVLSTLHKFTQEGEVRKKKAIRGKEGEEEAASLL